MLKAAQHLLAVTALLFGCVVGPETHVHPGEGPHSDVLVHAHAGLVGHTHNPRPGVSNAGEGPAIYLNAFSLTSAHAIYLSVPYQIWELVTPPTPCFGITRFALTECAKAHAPPGVDSGHLRAPPNYLPA